MPMPLPRAVADLIKADCNAAGVTGQNDAFYLSIATRILDAVKLATVVSTGVAPPGGGTVPSSSVTIT